MTRFLRRETGVICVGFAFACATLQGQSTPSAVTCTTPPASVVSFSIERVLALANIHSTFTPNLPASILASIASGAQEIREQLFYNPNTNVLRSSVFLVAPGSPNPTPPGTPTLASSLATYQLAVDKVYISCHPYPSVMFVGTLNSSVGGPNDRTGVYNANLIGDPAVVSIGYTTDNPPKINNIVELFAGIVVAYSSDATGTLTFPSSPVGPPGTTGPKIVLNVAVPATGNIQVFTRFFTLDASASADPNGLPLTFQWTVTPPVAITPSATSSVIDIQFPSLGDYTVMLTVTNSAGQSNTVSIPLEVLGRLP